MGDDATNSGYFVFVADKEKDLSSGSLYGAQVGAGFSLDPQDAAAPRTRTKLGSATSAEIRALAASLKATDIMEVRTPDAQDPAFSRVAANGAVEWIKLKPGMEKAAAFLETQRYAALVGASMGFTKMEGTTVNAKDAGDWGGIHNVVKGTLDPLVRANYKDKLGEAVGYRTEESSQVKLPGVEIVRQPGAGAIQNTS